MGEKTLLVYYPRYLYRNEGEDDIHHFDLTKKIQGAFIHSDIELIFTKGTDFYRKLFELRGRDNLALLFTDHFADPKTLSDENLREKTGLEYDFKSLPVYVVRTCTSFPIPQRAIQLKPSDIGSLPELVKKEFSKKGSIGSEDREYVA